MKKKYLSRALSMVLATVVTLSSVPVQSFAQENENADETTQELIDVSENDVSGGTSENYPEEELYEDGLLTAPQPSEDIFTYDWENASDEDLSQVIIDTSDADVKAWIKTLNDDQLSSLLARDTYLTQSIAIYSAAENPEDVTSQEFDTYYDYLESLPENALKTKFAAGTGSLTMNFGGVKYTVSLKNTNTFYSEINSTEKAGPGSNNTITVSPANGSLKYTSGGTSTWTNWDNASNGKPGYDWAWFNMSYTKPAGYTLSAPSFANKTGHFDFHTSKVFKPTDLNGASATACKHMEQALDKLTDLYNSKKITKNGKDNVLIHDESTYFRGSSTTTAQTISLIVIAKLQNFGFAGASKATATVTQTPITYYVTYNGGSKQACSYGSTYYRLGAQPAQTGKYTVEFNTQGVTTNPATATVDWTKPFLDWGAGLAAGSSFSNLTTTNGGTINYTARYGTQQTNSITLPNAAVAGKTFNGWYNGSSYVGKAGDTYTPSGNVKLTASYSTQSFSVTYNGNGGNVYDGTTVVGTNIKVGKAQFTESAPYGAVITDTYLSNEIAPFKRGYHFTNWTVTGSNYDSALKRYTITQNTTFTANWAPNTYTITYNPGDDGAVTPYDTHEVIFDDLCPAVPTASKIGYTFIEWVPENEEMQYKDKYTYDGDSIVNATYRPNTYTVKFNLDGGKVDGKASLDDILATYDETTIKIPATPTKEGYTFLGWTDDKGIDYAEGSESTNLAAEDGAIVAIKANWEKIEKENGGGGGNDKPVEVDPEFKKAVLEALATLKKTTDLTSDHISQLITILGTQYFMTENQAKTLIDLIKGNNGLTDEQKLALLQALATGTLTEDQKSLLVAMISKSSLSDADKKAILAAISGISSLTQEQQKQILSALEAGSSAQFDLDGVRYLLTKTANGTLSISIKGLNGKTDVTIPDFITVAGKTYPVTEIAKDAFKGNSDVKNAVMGDNIASIGESAFEGAKNLKTVTIGNNVREICDKAFKNCTSLGSAITLPASLQTIGKSAFEGTTKLQTIVIKEPCKLLEIGDKAFFKTGLKSFKLPASVLKVGAQAFASNKALKSFSFAKNAQLITVGKGAWSSDNVLKKISLPSKLTKVPANAFKADRALKSVKIPSGVTEIGTSAFEGTALTKVTIPKKVNTIGKKAFYSNKKLKTVTLKGSILGKVGAKAFKKCKKNIVFRCPKKKIASYKKILKGKY